MLYPLIADRSDSVTEPAVLASSPRSNSTSTCEHAVPLPFRVWPLPRRNTIEMRIAAPSLAQDCYAMLINRDKRLQTAFSTFAVVPKRRQRHTLTKAVDASAYILSTPSLSMVQIVSIAFGKRSPAHEVAHAAVRLTGMGLPSVTAFARRREYCQNFVKSSAVSTMRGAQTALRVGVPRRQDGSILVRHPRHIEVQRLSQHRINLSLTQTKSRHASPMLSRTEINP
jgi:hypothetical protein